MIKIKHIREEEYHASRYSGKAQYPKHYKYNHTYKIFFELKKRIGDARRKRILEYGCGEVYTAND